MRSARHSRSLGGSVSEFWKDCGAPGVVDSFRAPSLRVQPTQPIYHIFVCGACPAPGLLRPCEHEGIELIGHYEFSILSCVVGSSRCHCRFPRSQEGLAYRGRCRPSCPRAENASERRCAAVLALVEGRTIPCRKLATKDLGYLIRHPCGPRGYLCKATRGISALYMPIATTSLYLSASSVSFSLHPLSSCNTQQQDLIVNLPHLPCTSRLRLYSLAICRAVS